MGFKMIAFAVLLSSAVCSLALDILPVTRTPEKPKKVDVPSVTTDQLNAAFAQATDDAARRRKLEDSLPQSATLKPESKDAVVRHQRFQGFDQTVANLDLNASLLLSGSRFLKQSLNLSNDQAAFGLPNLHFPEESAWSKTINQCRKLFQPISCDASSIYRTADGTCNNLQNPNWGKSHSCMRRLIPAAYADGLSEPRKSKSNGVLPNVRTISLMIHEALVTPNAKFTHMFMEFGQFLTHDITMGLMTRTISYQSMLSCCDVGKFRLPECDMAIQIPPNGNDFFSNQGQTCMNFVRAAQCNSDCSFGPRQHVNVVSAYADTSLVYGNTETDTSNLRSFQDGLLLSQVIGSEEYLPYSFDPNTDQCSKLNDNLLCFQAGDVRVNQQPALTSLHNLFLRQHNRLARLFKQLHPTYNDEELFQLTRRVVNAQYQNIIFSEYLPIVFGPDYMKYFSLNTGSNSDYEPDTDVTIFNEFASSALRFGHTLIQNTLERGPGSSSSYNLDEVFFTPFFLPQGEFDPLLEGLSSQPGKEFERHLVTAVTHNLYRQKEEPFGMDLASLNIQRGRDQGTAPYTKYIEHCFGKKITSWKHLDDFMSTENRKSLQNVYESQDDIDLFTGGVSEDKMTGAAVGPTFGCILGSQFYNLKFGDRFYFEHKGQAGSFIDDQLKELRKTTLAQIICKNTKTVAEIVPNAFLIPSDSNKFTPCADIPDINYTMF